MLSNRIGKITVVDLEFPLSECENAALTSAEIPLVIVFGQNRIDRQNLCLVNLAQLTFFVERYTSSQYGNFG